MEWYVGSFLHVRRDPASLAKYKPYFDRVAADRPFRLAADLAFMVYEFEASIFGHSVDPLLATALYQDLTAFIQTLGLKSEDHMMMAVLLSRYYRRVADARTDSATDEQVRVYHVSTMPSERLMHAAYISQAQLYDDPLSRTCWTRVSNSTFSSFVNQVLAFSEAIDFHYYFSSDEWRDLYISMTGDLEKRAVAMYQELASQPEPEHHAIEASTRDLSALYFASHTPVHVVPPDGGDEPGPAPSSASLVDAAVPAQAEFKSVPHATRGLFKRGNGSSSSRFSFKFRPSSS